MPVGEGSGEAKRARPAQDMSCSVRRILQEGETDKSPVPKVPGTWTTNDSADMLYVSLPKPTKSAGYLFCPKYKRTRTEKGLER
jgi:hypothetical protein